MTMASPLIGRRDAIRVLGVTTLGLGAAWRSTSAVECILTPAQTEGPYYVADATTRRDITEGKPGVPLRIRLTVRDATTCQKLPGAQVEIWHCDAAGVYSGVNGAADTTTFLRGRQVSDRKGKVLFDTIYPGWYTGRTPHIHVKVHVSGTTVHTGQLYFDDTVTRAVYQKEPYAARGAADTTNTTDGIYASGGTQSQLGLRRRRRTVRGNATLVVST